jgi:hypothetical protein
VGAKSVVNMKYTIGERKMEKTKEIGGIRRHSGGINATASQVKPVETGF